VQGMRSSRLPLLCVALYFTVLDSPMFCVASLSFARRATQYQEALLG
jgi:hypothetical protein